MTITAAQIREARRLLRRSSFYLSRLSRVEFTVVLKAQLDADIGSVKPEAVRAIERSLVKAGIEFTADSVRLKKGAAKLSELPHGD